MIIGIDARWRIASRWATLASRDAWIVAALLGCFTAIRLPFLSHYLVNWDAVQYALGSQVFDIHNHQPHPPGYIGYIFLARLVNQLTGDANESLVLISVIGGALAPAGLYKLARSFVAQPFALLAAILFGTSPLLWYYSSVALNYAPNAALVIWMAWACYQARARRSAWHLLIATVLLSALGALRQTDMAFLLPLWVYTIWAFPWSTRLRVGGALAGLTLAWLIPLLWLSGGPASYVRESIALYRLVGGNTSIFTNPILGLSRNMFMVLVGILAGAHIGLLLIGMAAVRFRSLALGVPRGDWAFMVLWSGPALLVYLLGHMGQFGYVLLVLPIIFLWVGLALARLSERLIEPDATLEVQLGESRMLAGVISLFLLINLGGFTLGPPFLYQWASEGGRDANASLPRELLQYDLRESDQRWRDIIDIVRRYDPNTTAVLTSLGGPRLSGSFRTLSYYLPDYHIYGLDEDRSDSFGYLFSSYERHNNYSLAGLRHARASLPLLPGVRHVIIPDAEVAARLDLIVTRIMIYLNDGTQVVVAVLPAGTALAFSPEGKIVSDQPPFRATLFDDSPLDR